MGRRQSLAGTTAFTLLVLSVASGCQDGYPIAPTHCDEWCDASSRGLDCIRDEPAACVFACQERGGDAPECTARFEPLLACLRDAESRDLACNTVSYEDRPCAALLAVFAACAEPYARDGQGTLSW